jgi:hypothetical protein
MRMWRGAVVVCVAAAMTMLQGVAQTASVIASQIHGRIDGSQTTELQGNVHPVATAANDRGPVAGSLSMDRMLLVLKRTPDQDAALRSSGPAIRTWRRWWRGCRPLASALCSRVRGAR